MRVNYTTYDVRRAQDSINPRNHTDIMILAHEAGETYWYARVIGIFHADVRHTGPFSKHARPQRMEFLWVRWIGRDATYRSGFKAKRLPRVGFVPMDHEDPFGFLDPQLVIRAVHLMPAFAHGRTDELLGPSIVRQPRERNEDWQYFYVCM